MSTSNSIERNAPGAYPNITTTPAGHYTLTENILKADIDSRILMRRKSHARLPRNIPRPSILIALRIPNLQSVPPHFLLGGYIDVDSLAIASVATDCRGHDDEDVAVDKVADTPWLHVLRVLGGQLKAQALRHGGEEEERKSGEELHRRQGGKGKGKRKRGRASREWKLDGRRRVAKREFQTGLLPLCGDQRCIVFQGKV
jgi:hypothetical protein